MTWLSSHDIISSFQAAERALSTRCGNLNATFIGNAPCGYLDYKLPQNSEEYGVKVKQVHVSSSQFEDT